MYIKCSVVICFARVISKETAVPVVRNTYNAILYVLNGLWGVVGGGFGLA